MAWGITLSSAIQLARVCLRKHLLGAFAVVGAWSEQGAAQTVSSDDAALRVFSLETAVHHAVRWHPSVERAIASLSASGQEIREARSGYYPQVTGGLEPGMTVIGGPSWRPRATVSASQMIYDFGKVSSTLDMARAGEKVSRAELLMAVDNLSRDTSYAVIEVQRYRALLAVAQEQLESLKAINALVQMRVQRGASARSDGTQAEARIQSADNTILQIKSELQRWQSNLRYLTGHQGDVDVTAESPAWLGNACQMPTPELDRVPAILQSHAQRDRAQAAYRAAQAGGLPKVSFGVDVDADMRDPFKRQNDVRVGFKVSSSLYQGGGQRARERASFHELQAAEAAVAATRVEVLRSFSESREQISHLRERIGTLGARKKNMQETRMLYRLQHFDLGSRTLLDLLNAEQELFQIQFEEVNAEHDMRRLNVTCLHQSGTMRDAFSLTGTELQGTAL